MSMSFGRGGAAGGRSVALGMAKLGTPGRARSLIAWSVSRCGARRTSALARISRSRASRRAASAIAFGSGFRVARSRPALLAGHRPGRVVGLEGDLEAQLLRRAHERQREGTDLVDEEDRGLARPGPQEAAREEREGQPVPAPAHVAEGEAGSRLRPV